MKTSKYKTMITKSQVANKFVRNMDDMKTWNKTYTNSMKQSYCDPIS